MNNTFWVGVYPGMTDEMIAYMAKVIIEAVKQKGKCYEKSNSDRC
jgi:CDP-6-deoxy-D-xylo-4-hexulose-3-dehydrase